MKIDELVPFKKTPFYQTAKDQLDYDAKLDRPTRMSLITSKLKNQGYEVHKIGSGAYAEVFKRPQDNYVIKVFGEDKGYLAYLKYILEHRDNPHVPKIHGSLVKPFKDRPMYIVRLEILEARDAGNPEHWDLCNTVDMAVNGAPGAVANIAKRYPKLLEVVVGIQELLGNGQFMNDIHVGNIMYRQDGTPVITDPLFN